MGNGTSSSSYSSPSSTSSADPLHWWNPRRIVLQILLLQSCYIILNTLLITFVVLVMGAPFRIDYTFLDSRYQHTNVFGWSLCFLSILASAFMYSFSFYSLFLICRILALVLIVRRSQLVLDFVLTLQFIQLLLTMWYNWHIPSTALWWGSKCVETAIMVIGGRHFCMLRTSTHRIGIIRNGPNNSKPRDIEGEQQENGS